MHWLDGVNPEAISFAGAAPTGIPFVHNEWDNPCVRLPDDRFLELGNGYIEINPLTQVILLTKYNLEAADNSYQVKGKFK